MEELSKKEKIKALEDFFGVNPEEAESQLEDMSEIDYGEREHKPEEVSKMKKPKGWKRADEEFLNKLKNVGELLRYNFKKGWKKKLKKYNDRIGWVGISCDEHKLIGGSNPYRYSVIWIEPRLISRKGHEWHDFRNVTSMKDATDYAYKKMEKMES